MYEPIMAAKNITSDARKIHMPNFPVSTPVVYPFISSGVIAAVCCIGEVSIQSLPAPAGSVCMIQSRSGEAGLLNSCGPQ